MYYQKPQTVVLIGNAMIPDHLVRLGYVGTLCFSVCKNQLSDDDSKRQSFDVSLTLAQLELLRQSITDYLRSQSEYSLSVNRFGDYEGTHSLHEKA